MIILSHGLLVPSDLGRPQNKCILKVICAGELLDTLPPGVDEAVAISKVVQLARSPDYKGFSRVVFDTAPTGHTLRLLTLPEFLDATIGKQPLADSICSVINDTNSIIPVELMISLSFDFEARDQLFIAASDVHELLPI